VTEEEERPTFVVRFVAARGIDPVKALRRLLKTAIRRFGLKAVEVREDKMGRT
jgi:hypothetical protein